MRPKHDGRILAISMKPLHTLAWQNNVVVVIPVIFDRTLYHFIGDTKFGTNRRKGCCGRKGCSGHGVGSRATSPDEESGHQSVQNGKRPEQARWSETGHHRGDNERADG